MPNRRQRFDTNDIVYLSSVLLGVAGFTEVSFPVHIALLVVAVFCWAAYCYRRVAWPKKVRSVAAPAVLLAGGLFIFYLFKHPAKRPPFLQVTSPQEEPSDQPNSVLFNYAVRNVGELPARDVKVTHEAVFAATMDQQIADQVFVELYSRLQRQPTTDIAPGVNSAAITIPEYLKFSPGVQEAYLHRQLGAFIAMVAVYGDGQGRTWTIEFCDYIQDGFMPQSCGFHNGTR